MGRPAIRSLLRLAAGLAVLVLALAAFVLDWGSRRLEVTVERFEAEVGPLDPSAHAPGHLGDAENAAVWLRSGAAALDLDGSDWAVLDDFLAAESPAPSAAVEDLLARCRPALEDLHRAGNLDRSSFGIDYLGGPDALPTGEITAQLRVRKVLSADARLGLATADYERVARNLRAIAFQRDVLLREPAFVFQLIARAVEAGYHDLVQDLLLSETVGRSLLETARTALEDPDLDRALDSAFAVEASWMRGVVDTAPNTVSGAQRLVERLTAPFVAADGIDLYRRLSSAADFPGERDRRLRESAGSAHPGDGHHRGHPDPQPDRRPLQTPRGRRRPPAGDDRPRDPSRISGRRRLSGGSGGLAASRPP